MSVPQIEEDRIKADNATVVGLRAFLIDDPGEATAQESGMLRPIPDPRGPLPGSSNQMQLSTGMGRAKSGAASAPPSLKHPERRCQELEKFSSKQQSQI